jgi:hypothetical protein
MGEWPLWWQWQLEFSPHLLKRMVDRSFTETDVRLMLEVASGHHADVVAGRYVIETRHEDQAWEVIVEPEDLDRVLIVITAYPVWSFRS